MSHDIDFSTGKPAIAYVGEMPWHKLGQQLPAGEPIEVWVRAARLEWELKRLPVQYVVDGELRTMDERFVLVRSDTGLALSVVSGDYHIVQPKAVLEFYRDLVSTFGYTLETAGALAGGRKVWALARTGKAGLAGSDASDHLAAYVLLATSCDKSLATTAAFTSIRVVCQNTLCFAVEDVAQNKRPQLKIPHTNLFDAEWIKVKLGLLDGAWNGFLAKVDALTSKKLTPADAAAFFQALFPQKDGRRLSPKAQNEITTLLGLYTGAPGQGFVSAKGTLWGAVNAVSYYVDHVRASATDRLDSAWFGAGNALKDRAWAAAASMATEGDT